MFAPLFVESRRFWSNLSLRTKGLVTVAVPLAAMLLSFALSYLVDREHDKATSAVEQSVQVRAASDKLLGNFAIAKIETLAAMSTGDEALHGPSRKAQAVLRATLFNLLEKVQDSPLQLENARRVQSLVENNLAEWTLLPEAGRGVASPGAQPRTRRSGGNDLDALRHATEQLDAEEETLLTRHSARLRQIEGWRTLTDAGGVVLGLLGAVVAMVLFSEGVSRRVADLQKNADRLAEGLPLLASTPGDDELGDLAQHLHKASKQRREAEDALRAAKAEAERANAAKSEFLSRMSHELRTPLNAILGFGQLLEMDGLPEHQGESVGQILKGGHHLLGLVDEVLDLARLEAGKLGFTLGPVPLVELARESVSLVGRLAQARGITCTLEGPTALWGVAWGDGPRLRQVILNLLANAIKYNHEGGRVRVVCQPGAPGEPQTVRLGVEDTGPGIPAEGLARLFVPFDRLGREFGEVEGTGLGLAVSRRLMEAMGGALQVQSEVGRGSTFWIELPVADLPAPPSEEAYVACPDEVVPVVPEERPPKTVLHVEDNVSNAQVVAMAVARLRPGWRLIAARDGESALAQARAEAPDAVLLDLHLPDIGGERVLDALQADARLRRVPVIMLSADAMATSRARLLAGGAHAYLSKPFEIPHLLAALDDALSVGTSGT